MAHCLSRKSRQIVHRCCGVHIRTIPVQRIKQARTPGIKPHADRWHGLRKTPLYKVVFTVIPTVITICLSIFAFHNHLIHHKSSYTMKKSILTLLLLAAAMTNSRAEKPAQAHGYPIDPVPFTSVKVTDSFWGQRLKASRYTAGILQMRGDRTLS